MVRHVVRLVRSCVERDTFVILLSVFVWLCKGAFVLSTPIQSIAHTPYLIDDSFIQMQIASNVARGRGFSLDGSSTTSGSPPLWVLLTVPLHLGLDKDSAAKATVLLSASIASFCSVLVYSVVRRQFGRLAAWISFLIASLSLPLFFQSMNGMETFLFAAIGLTVLSLSVAHAQTLPMVTAQGILLGLLVWCRADGVFLAPLVVLWDFALGIDRQRRVYFLRGMVKLCAWGVAVLLLMMWNHLMSGQWLPANQRGRYWLAHGYWTTWSLAAYLRQSVNNVAMFVSLYRVTLGSLVLILLSVGIVLALTKSHTEQALFPYISYGVLMVFLYSFYQWYFPDVHGLRYIVFSSLILTICIGGALEYLAIAARRYLSETMVGTLLVVLVISILSSSGINYRRLIDQLEGTQWAWLFGVHRQGTSTLWCEVDWINRYTAPGTRVAAKDFGRLAYFTDRPIVDLVGIVDPEVISFIRAGALVEYLRDKEVEYVIAYRNSDYYLNQALRLPDNGALEIVPDFCPDSPHPLYKIIDDSPSQ